MFVILIKMFHNTKYHLALTSETYNYIEEIVLKNKKIDMCILSRLHHSENKVHEKLTSNLS